MIYPEKSVEKLENIIHEEENEEDFEHENSY